MQMHVDFPGIIPLAHPRLAHELGYGSANHLYRARSRGTFPVRVISRSGTLAVLRADLLKYLATGIAQTGSVSVAGRNYLKKTGRPTKAEQAEAREKGLTVPELRAMQEGA